MKYDCGRKHKSSWHYQTVWWSNPAGEDCYTIVECHGKKFGYGTPFMIFDTHAELSTALHMMAKDTLGGSPVRIKGDPWRTDTHEPMAP